MGLGNCLFCYDRWIVINIVCVMFLGWYDWVIVVMMLVFVLVVVWLWLFDCLWLIVVWIVLGVGVLIGLIVGC